MDRAAAVTGQLSGFTTQVKEVASKCESMQSSIEKCWLAKKCHLNLTTFMQDVIKITNHIKVRALTHACSCSPVRSWMQSTHGFSDTQGEMLSKGRSLARLSELQQPLQRFLLENITTSSTFQ